MLKKAHKERLETRFSAIEASFQIEGLDPSHDDLYAQAKAQVLAGKVTAEEALAFVVDQTTKLTAKTAVA